jgi:hypothetical protein
MKKMTAKALVLAMMLSGFLVTVPQPAHASQVDLLIEKLVEKKILSRLDAEAIRSEIETAEKKDYKAQVKSASPWIEGLSSKGDIRLRYEAFNRESEDNRTATGDAGGTDRNRIRFRARWGLEKKVNDEFKAGFRIASGGGTTDATSTNQSLDGEFGLKDVFFDRAYGIWTPTKRVQEMLGTGVNVVEVGAGKVENPYDRDKWNTSIIWDSDVTPEGIYEKVDFRLMDDAANDAYWDLNTLQGQWVVDEDSDNSPGDQEMQSYGAGTTYQWKKGHNAAFKATYYDWQEYANFIMASSALGNNTGGNDRTVDDFRILNFYGETTFDVPTWWWGTQPLKLFGDYATNMGDETDPNGSTDETLVTGINTNSQRQGEDEAWSAGFTLGRSKEEKDWAFTYEYLYIEPNAVVGNFAESDLGLGFANNKGHRLAFKYMIHKNLELGFTAWLVERVNKSIATFGAADNRVAGDDDQVLRTQLDLVYKF